MRAAAILLSLMFLAGCVGDTGESGTGRAADSPEPTWSVACEPGREPVESIGDLELPCLGDESPTTVGVRDGRPLVIVLWASWCPPCIEEAPEVEAFWQAHGDRIDVLGVDSADTRSKARWFAEEFDLTYPSVSDAEEQIRIALGVPALPGIAFIAPDGTIAEVINEPGVTADILTRTAESAFELELP